MALTPAEQAELDQLLAEENAHSAPTGAGGTGNVDAPPLEDMLDPQFDLVPQALAAQPSTTHPGGDETAESEFLRKPGEASKGTVFVYEPPLAVVQKRLAADPAFGAALSPSLPPDPDRIARLTRDDSLYQMAADQMWRETADATASSGKTAYRYSKAPWLQGGGAMNAIQSLGMKAIGAVGPAMDTVNSFVMGVDKTGLLGAGRAVDETISGGDPKVVPGIEQAGIPQENAKQYNERTVEEHPVANMTGQGLALLKPWGAANMLYKAATGLTGKAAAAAGGGLTARVLAGGAGAALGGGAVQVGQDTVTNAGAVAQGGEAPIPIGEMASRAGQAAADPMNAGFGAAGEVLGSLAGRGAEQFREGPRYGGAPGRFERLGGEFRLGKGPVAPEPVKSAEVSGKALDVKPVDVLAKEIAPKVAEAEAKAVKDVKLEVEARNAPYYQSREGKLKLPVEATQNEALTQLREKHTLDAKKGRLAPINGKSDVDYTKKFFNRNIDGVSLKPSPGAIELSPDEAEAFLAGNWKQDLLPKPKKPPPSPGGGAREVDLGGGGGPTPDTSGGGWKPMPKPESVGATGMDRGSLAPEAKPSLDSLRPGKAARAERPTAPAKDPNMKELGAVAVDPVREAGPAIRRENARMAALDKETAGTALPEWKPNSGKTYISDLYDQAKGKFKTREDFNKALMEAHKGSKGGLLQRIDLTETADPSKLKASRVKAVNGEYDLVDSSKASDLLKQWGIVGAGAAATAAASDDKEGSAAAGAGALGLAMLLKKKGIQKVYVSPKRYTASEHEVLKDHLQTLSADPQSPEGRQARQLYKAAFIDRDARPMNGVPGGWSAHQNENSKMIDEVKSRAALAAPGGDSFGALVDYSKQREGQLPLVEAVRSAAERAGVRPQLDQLRLLDPHQTLLKEMSMGHAGTGRGVSPTVLGAANRFFDAGAMRLGYPALQSLGGPMSPIRGGMAGRAGSIKREEKKDKTP